MASRRTFKRYGQSGIEVSDLFQNVAQHIDDLGLLFDPATTMASHIP